uniref:Uncharacterized protein n=1 Tax=Nicotiana tabacum TaxID=4097 RepID=A0A1S3XE75_TOBAC|nr:PREDICTED: uncharacterized protein LOC107764133 [Nicotiana tabacum]
MSNLSKLEFVALDISEKNCLSWVLDAEIHLAVKGLGDTITQGLKVEYLTVNDPLELWTDLKERDVMNDEDLLAKTLTTFHASNTVLQQQYRERGFKKYSELISCLLMVEQHNTLLLKNHEARPTGSAPLPKANMVARCDKYGKRQNNNHGHMNVRRHDNGKRRYNSRHRGGHGK